MPPLASKASRGVGRWRQCGAPEHLLARYPTRAAALAPAAAPTTAQAVSSLGRQAAEVAAQKKAVSCCSSAASFQPPCSKQEGGGWQTSVGAHSSASERTSVLQAQPHSPPNVNSAPNPGKPNKPQRTSCTMRRRPSASESDRPRMRCTASCFSRTASCTASGWQRGQQSPRCPAVRHTGRLLYHEVCRPPPKGWAMQAVIRAGYAGGWQGVPCTGGWQPVPRPGPASRLAVGSVRNSSHLGDVGGEEVSNLVLLLPLLGAEQKQKEWRACRLHAWPNRWARQQHAYR